MRSEGGWRGGLLSIFDRTACLFRLVSATDETLVQLGVVSVAGGGEAQWVNAAPGIGPAGHQLSLHASILRNSEIQRSQVEPHVLMPVWTLRQYHAMRAFGKIP